MEQFSVYLLSLAIYALYYGWKEIRKPKEQRRTGLGALFLIAGVGYFVWSWWSRGGTALAAAAYNMMYLGTGAVLCLLGLLRAVAPPPHRNRVLAVILVIAGLVLVAFGLGWL